MSDNKIFSRSKSSELLQELDQIDKKSKNSLQRKKNVVKKVICNVTIGNNEMINMFSQILKLHETCGDDMEFKRLTTFYMVTYATLKPELGSRLLDLLYRDLLDRNGNPALISLLLKSIASINLNLERIISPIKKILNDPKGNETIKKTACFSIARIYEFNPKLAGEHDLLKTLNDQLYDTNVSVVTTLLLALNDITERNPSLQLRISKDHAIKLLNSALKSNEWSVVYILNSLMSFIPQTNDEALLIIDKVMPILQHENSSVVLNAVKVIIFNCNYVINPDDVIPTLPRRLGNALVSLLSKQSEIQFLVLRNIILLLLSKPNLVQFDIKMFFCKYDDPIYVKDTKLEIIYLLANDDNIDIVLEELEEYATDVDILMSRKLVRAIGNLAVKLESCCFTCIKLLDDLIVNGAPYIVQEGAIVFKNILRKYQDIDFSNAITNLIEHSDIIDEPESKDAAIWIIGNYCEIIPNLNVLLEEFGMDFKEESLNVQLVYLTSIVKYYLKFPKQGTDLVVKYLKIVTEEMNNPDLRERGFFYWRIVSNSDTKTASLLINAPLPVISSENEKLDQSILEELELNIGSLASIYLKPVNQVFRLAKLKTIPKSPALQPRLITTLMDSKKSTTKPNFKSENVVTPATINNDRFESIELTSTKTSSTQPLRDEFAELSSSTDTSIRNSRSSSSATTSTGMPLRGRQENKKLGRKLSMSFKKMIN